MREKFHTLVSSFLKPTDKILIAVSGGLDSIVLLDLAAACDLNFSIAHVNFQLRGNESDSDELFVKEMAQKHNVTYFAKKFDTAAYAEEKAISKQMAARQLRYGWFAELLTKEHIDYLFTAHHANDNLETALLNFVRGTGISGLRGMNFKNEKTIRPLLSFSRDEIARYASVHKLVWREDSSNSSADYQRNFIRQQIIPTLKEINPSLENTFQENTERFKGEEELAMFALTTLSNTYVQTIGDQTHIDKKILDSFTNKTGILWELIKTFGFNLNQCHSIIGALLGESGKQFHSTDFTLTIDRQKLILSQEKLELLPLEILEHDEFISTKRVELTLSKTSRPLFSDLSDEALLDKDHLKFPLILRHWRSGDFFYPLGMTNKKKVSDFLIDEKISLADKSNVLVLESDGRIVWLLGHRIDDRFKITPETKTALSIKLQWQHSGTCSLA